MLTTLRRRTGGATSRLCSRRLAPALLVLAALLTGLAATAAQAAGTDGPGSYFMFRSFDTGNPTTTTQDSACSNTFGAVRGAAAIKLNAAMFGFASDPTGQVIDQKAGYLGPIYACVAPTPALAPELTAGSGTEPVLGLDLLDIFMFASPTRVGVYQDDGPCSMLAPRFVLDQAGSLAGNCKVPLRGDPSGRIAGGLATSNSVLNVKNLVPGAPTGSIWTTYVVPKKGQVLPPPAPPGPAPATPAPSPGLEFYVFRTFQTTVAKPASCPGSLLAAGLGARSSVLSATAPRPSDGELVPGPLVHSGGLTLCLSGASAGSQQATAQLEVTRGGRLVHIAAAGDCRELPTPAGPSLRQQACDLEVQSSSDPAVHGGLLTSNGLVPANAPLTTANSHIWTVSLFTGQV